MAKKDGMTVLKYCDISDVPRSLYYSWKNRGITGEGSKFKPAGRKPGYSGKGILEEESILEDIKMHPALDNYNVAKNAGVSTSTVRRVRLKHFPKKKKAEFRSRKKKRVTFSKLNVCWSTDIMHVKVREGDAYLQIIVEERSREVLASRLHPDINAGLSAGLLKDTIAALDVSPLTMKFDRGSEFKNDTFLTLLDENKIIPLTSPPHYPKYNGKSERVFRYIRDHIKGFGVMPYEETRDVIEKEIGYMNRKKRRPIFGGLTSDQVYAKEKIVTEKERYILQKRIKRAMYRMKKKKMKWIDELDLIRKNAEKPLINMGLLYLNNREPDYRQIELDVPRIAEEKRLKIRIAKGYEKYSPASDVLAPLMEEWHESARKAVYEKYFGRTAKTA
jgi:transposase InsO family protein